MMAYSLQTHLPFILTGLLTGCAISAVLMQILPGRILRYLGLLFFLPGPGLAFVLPLLHEPHITFWQGLLISPTVLFPIGATLLGLPAGTARAAIGLGADLKTRFQLIWLPVLLPSVLLSLGLAILLCLGCVILDCL
ncbi:hypothetical protein [Gluconobacter morbifer]|uniref:Uncharacterized protein n=1 Tax=Gluconobacter morbifer G707 TaxID=1088869 RepID=G6XJ11_9PROT|nr:hypothetical protein [Gluconobacter morbifer]EHH68127.1 hypothetical protein GMO_14770 [Gluconobacter morbifer G707]